MRDRSYAGCGRRLPPNSALQSTHSAVTPLAMASVAPAGGRLNASVRHREVPGSRAVTRRVS
jgi:hypothetical protein